MTKINYKKIAIIMGWIFTAAGLVSSLAFAIEKESRVIVRDVDVEIGNNDENIFITEGELRAELANGENGLMGKSYRAVDLAGVERHLDSHPAVAGADVAADVRGTIHVKVMQREPILRVMNRDGESYYLDTEGRLMPLSDHFTARVPIASGEINEPYSRRYQFSAAQIAANETYSELSVLDDLAILATSLRNDSLLSALIHQINVTRDKEFEMFPSIGYHRIVLGDIQDLDQKLNKLKVFYREGLNRSDGWNRYTVINLKFKNQVVCTKK